MLRPIGDGEAINIISSIYLAIDLSIPCPYIQVTLSGYWLWRMNLHLVQSPVISAPSFHSSPPSSIQYSLIFPPCPWSPRSPYSLQMTSIHLFNHPPFLHLFHMTSTSTSYCLLTLSFDHQSFKVTLHTPLRFPTSTTLSLDLCTSSKVQVSLPYNIAGIKHTIMHNLFHFSRLIHTITSSFCQYISPLIEWTCSAGSMMMTNQV